MQNSNQHSRRAFLGFGAAGLGVWSLGGLRQRGVLHGMGGLGGGDEILVVLQLSGGNDGLNTIIPYQEAEYRRARGRLAIASKDVLPLDGGLGLHPNLKGLAGLYQSKRLAVIQGVGYPNPNRSHFKSMDIWHAADPTGRDLRYGWLGRALDLATRAAPDPDLAVNVSARAPLALNGVSYKPISFQNPGSYRFVGSADVTESFEKMVREPAAEKNSVLARLRRTAKEAVETSDAIRTTATRYRTPVRYPRNQLAAPLRTVASLIGGGLSTRVYYTYQGGYDTHTNQAGRHANLLLQLDQAVTAFQQDLERLGAADRVVLMVFSEFGRRVRANASGGTDHGVAAPVLLLGSRVRGGLYGRHPSLEDLTKGDLKHNVDFRRIYKTLLDDWLRIESKKVLRGEFEALPLLA